MVFFVTPAPAVRLHEAEGDTEQAGPDEGDAREVEMRHVMRAAALSEEEEAEGDGEEAERAVDVEAPLPRSVLHEQAGDDRTRGH